MAEFTFYNNSDELTLSADGFTYGYLGRATLQSVVQPTTGAIQQQAGYSTYTIDWPADIVVALPLKANRYVSLVSTVQSGSTWTITVRNSNGAVDGNGFDSQEATEVFVFGAPQQVLTMINLFDVNGSVVADLARRPITYKAIVDYPNNEYVKAMPGGISVPAVLGAPRDRYTSTSSAGSGLFWNVISAAAWYWNTSTGNLEKAQFRLNRAREDGSVANVQLIRPATALIIEAAGL